MKNSIFTRRSFTKAADKSFHQEAAARKAPPAAHPDSQEDFNLAADAEPTPVPVPDDLIEIRRRAHAILDFTIAMRDPRLSPEERDREMSKVRAHCKGLSEAARDFLRDNQPDWYKLDQAGRSEAVRRAFK